MKSKAFVALVIVLLLNCTSCKETPTADGNGNGDNGLIVAEDIGVTDVLLKINMPGAFDQRSVTLKRDTVTILNKTIFSRDTLIVDEGLLPKHTYLYTISFDMTLGIQEHGTIAVTTMDTTSHNFTWEIDTLGGRSSVLFDVAIINDTLAYAVGEIYKRDSLGQWNTDPYNFLKWDGKKWEMKSITYVPVRTVFAFSENDIWTGTSAPYHWDGNIWKVYNVTGIFNGYINKIWGTSSTNLYMVGTNGSIAHYNGVSWQKLESGTDVNLTDIWGTPSGDQVWACGENDDDGRSVLLSLNGNTFVLLWNNRIPTPPYVYSYGLTTLWSSGRKEFILSGSSGYVYRHSILDLTRIRQDGGVDLGNYPYRLRGSASNNVFVAGDEIMLWHFNGVSWHRYDNLLTPNDVFYGLAVSDRLVVGVGSHYVGGPIRDGLVIIGRKR